AALARGQGSSSNARNPREWTLIDAEQWAAAARKPLSPALSPLVPRGERENNKDHEGLLTLRQLSRLVPRGERENAVFRHDRSVAAGQAAPLWRGRRDD